MKKLKFTILAIGFASISFAQVGVNTETPNATLDIEASNTNNNPSKGILIPRLTANEVKTMTEAANAIGEKQNSILVYITKGFSEISEQSGKFKFISGKGYYYYDYNTNIPANSRWLKVMNTSEASNIYTTDGTITGTRTVTLTNDNSNITLSKSGANNNPLLVANGTIKASAFDANSDARLKTNIKNLSSKKIEKLRPVSYSWNAEGKKRGGNNKLQYGFIAQEIEQVFPNLVSTGDDGYKSVNYIEVIPVLTKALQEEQELNKSQQKQLENQSQEIKKLKEIVNNMLHNSVSPVK